MGSIIGRIDGILETYGSIDNYYKQIRMNITHETENIDTSPHVIMPKNMVLFSARELGKEISHTLQTKGWENLINKNDIIEILKKYNVYESK